MQAVYEDDVEYLELLLDHAVAAQEEENEAKQQKRLNGELEPAVRIYVDTSIWDGGGREGGGKAVYFKYERACGSVIQ